MKDKQLKHLAFFPQIIVSATTSSSSKVVNVSVNDYSVACGIDYTLALVSMGF